MENNSGGARELVPGSVCRKGLSYRDQQLDRYVSQESHYPLPSLTLPPFFYFSCSFAHDLGPGWDDLESFCGNPRWAPVTSVVGRSKILCPTFLLTHYDQVLFSPHCGKTDLCHLFSLIFLLILSPLSQETKSPAFLLHLLSQLITNSCSPFFFLSACHLGWGNKGAPLCHWSRYEDEKVKPECPHWAKPEIEVKVELGLVGPVPEVEVAEEEVPGPRDMSWRSLSQRVGVAQLPVLGQKSRAVLMSWCVASRCS